MNIYLLILLMLAGCAFLEVLPLKRYQCHWLLVVEAVVVILFFGLRYNTGADWYLYLEAYHALPENLNGWELGYHWLALLVHNTIGNYYVIQFLSSMFLVTVVAKFIWRYASYPLLTFALFVCLFMHNSLLFAQVRQSFALGFVVIAVQYVFERKWVKYMVFVGVACLFHISAIVAFVFVACLFEWKKVIHVSILVVSGVFAMYSSQVKDFILFILPYLPERISVVTNKYFENALFSGNVDYNTGLFGLTFFLLVLLVILLSKPQNKIECFFLNALTVAMAVKNMSSSILVLDRLVAYFMVFGMFAYTMLLALEMRTQKHQQLNQLFMSVMLCVYMALPVYKMVTTHQISEVSHRPGYYSYTPYYNVLWHPKEADERKDWCE